MYNLNWNIQCNNKGWLITAIIITIYCLIVGFLAVVDNEGWGYFLIVSGICSLFGIIFEVFFNNYFNYRYKVSLILFLVAGICQGPIGIFVILAGLKINDVPTIRERKGWNYNLFSSKLEDEKPTIAEQFEPIKTKVGFEERTTRFAKESLLKIWLYCCKNKYFSILKYFALSTFSGFVLGWYFKKPNLELLTRLSRVDSLWRKNIILESFEKKSSFFSSEYFDFNWTVFLLSTLVFLFIFLFINNKVFRQYIFDKFSFKQ